MSIGLYLMTMKGLHVLDALVGRFGPQWIQYVIGARDQQLVDDSFEDIRSRCSQHGIPFAERREPVQPVAQYNFAVSWRWLIPDAPNLIVFHDSLLPRYRGFAPLPTALINGDRTIGVTALLASDNYDAGDVLGQKALDISYPIKIQDAIQRISRLYGDLIIELCEGLKNGKALARQPQDEGRATYSLWRDEEDYNIDWSGSSSHIKRFVDSLGYPYKGASSYLNRRLTRIYEAEVVPDVQIENRQAGKVIFVNMGYPVIVCGHGLVRLTDLRDAETGQSILPLKQFRSRFSDRQ